MVRTGGTFGCLIRFALANIRRRPERFVLSVLGIALAIACVTVVRTISASFAITGADSVVDVLGDAQLWAVPAAGVHYDTETRALVADGPPPAFDLPDGWHGRMTISGVTVIDGAAVSLRGSDEVPSDQAVLGSGLADRLGVAPGEVIEVGALPLTATVSGAGSR